VLALCALPLNLTASVLVFFVSGVLAAYQVAANAAFIMAVPNDQRGQAYGLASTGLQVSQGLAYVAAGAAALVLSPADVIVTMGAAGALAALWVISQHRLHLPALPSE